VRNIPNTPIGPNLIRATFSIANWGSTIADSNAPWNVVGMQAGPPPTLAENILRAPGPAPDGDLTGTRIQFTCTPGASDTYCPLREPGTHQHQCMLVELSEGSNVLPVKFSKAAAYRNMNFETLSELSRPATITLK